MFRGKERLKFPSLNQEAFLENGPGEKNPPARFLAHVFCKNG